MLGRALAGVGELDEAMDAFDRCVETARGRTGPPVANARDEATRRRERLAAIAASFERGERDRGRDQFELAVQAYRVVLAEIPAHREARRGLGISLYELGQTERARAEFERVLNGEPGDPIARSYLELLK